ncbi:uncharacterized protein [Ptychodera flava]|uniref:uncharacterized protein n=1 Tax=Ptychodera flava TaxID=63121 RepID=UPI00396A1959
MTKAELVARVHHFIANKIDTIVDPDPNNIYTELKRRSLGLTRNNKLATTQPSTSIQSCFPVTGWGTSLEKLPLFSRAQMDHYATQGGKALHRHKRGEATSFQRGSVFHHENYIFSLQTAVSESLFFFKSKCFHSYSKTKDPHSLKLALHLVSGEVLYGQCTCVAGKSGFCNHMIGLMFRICEFSLYGYKDVNDENLQKDLNGNIPVTSKLQKWNQRRTDGIEPTAAMDVAVKKLKVGQKNQGDAVCCTLYQAVRGDVINVDNEVTLKKNCVDRNPKSCAMLITPLNDTTNMIDTKAGEMPRGSVLSYQLAPSESNFAVYISTNPSARVPVNTMPLISYPRFPLSSLPTESTDKQLPDCLKAL